MDPDTTVTAATLREVIAPAAELTAYKYFYTDIDTYEKSQKVWKVKVPFTTDKSVFSYSGEIGAGIDLDNAEFWKNIKANTETVLRSIMTASNQLDAYTIDFSWEK